MQLSTPLLHASAAHPVRGLQMCDGLLGYGDKLPLSTDNITKTSILLGTVFDS